jgi:hypothetical protein
MRTYRLAWCLLLLVLLGLTAGPAWAVGENELWRSELGRARAVSLSPFDGTVWAAIGNRLYHYAGDGSLLGKVELYKPSYLSPVSPDGGFWVLDRDRSDDPYNTLHRFDADGRPRFSRTGWSEDQDCAITMIVANQTDGTCWYSLSGSPHRIVHLAADGTELLNLSYYGLPGVGGSGVEPGAWAVDSADGSLWGVRTVPIESSWDSDLLVHLSAAGELIWHGGDRSLVGRSMAVDPVDHSVWVVCPENDLLVHFAADGTELWRGVREDLLDVWVSPADRTLWVYDATGLTHLTPDGQTVLWSEGGTHPDQWSIALSIDPRDGSYWRTPATSQSLFSPNDAYWSRGTSTFGLDLQERGEPALRHLAADGTTLWESAAVAYYSALLLVDPVDGSVWVQDLNRDPLVRLSPDGEVLAQAAPDSHLAGPAFLAFDPTDRSVLVRDAGEELPQDPPGGAGPVPVPWHGSTLVRYALDGTEIWRGETIEAILGEPAAVWLNALQIYRDFAEPGIAVSAADGAFWAVQPVMHLDPEAFPVWPQLVMRYAHGGAELLRYSLPLNHAVLGIAGAPDGSCWLAVIYLDSPEWVCYFLHLAPDGRVLQQLDAAVLGRPLNYAVTVACLAVNASDGSVWISYNGHVGKLNSLGELLWSVPFEAGALEVDPVTGFAWTGNHRNLYPDWGTVSVLSNTGQVLWQRYGFRPPGRPAFDPVDGTCWIGDPDNLQLVHLSVPLTRFNDIPYDHWAIEQIRAVSEADLVGGYADGCYRPTGVMTRDQMAVYVSRAMAGGDSGVPAGPPLPSFTDVPPTHWAYRYVEYCSAHGVVGGYGNGQYRPDLSVTRDQMAVYVQRAFDLPL